MESLLVTIVFLATIGAGVMAGFFYGFSNVVMGAFRRLETKDGVLAMQLINVVVLNPIFFALFFGTAILSLAVLVLAALGLGGEWVGFAVAGGLLYLLGIIVVTVVFNVPMNNGLARIEADAANAGDVWSAYLKRWVAWNHVRTFSGVGSLALYAAALLQV